MAFTLVKAFGWPLCPSDIPSSPSSLSLYFLIYYKTLQAYLSLSYSSLKIDQPFLQGILAPFTED